MEKLQSSRPWRKKINGSPMMAKPDYSDVFGLQARNAASFSVHLEDYPEIFAAAASVSSIPVLDLSTVENGFEKAGDGAGAGGLRSGVDYSDVFGTFGSFAASYEDLFAVPERSEISISDGRAAPQIVSSEQSHTEDKEPYLEMNQRQSSFIRLSDDSGSKRFSMPSHRMSRENLDNIKNDNKTHKHKFNAVNDGNISNACTNGFTPDDGQKNEAMQFFSSSTNCVPLKDTPPRDEKSDLLSSVYHSASIGGMPLHDASYLKVSEISLHTAPYIGPPPTRSPPRLPEKPELLKAFHTESKSVANDHMPSNSESMKVGRVAEYVKGTSFLRDAEIDPSSAAAASIAAIKVAMEQAQIRLASAKKQLNKKRVRKALPPKAVNDKEEEGACEVELKSCSQVIDANKLLKESSAVKGCPFVQGEETVTSGKELLSHEERNIQLPLYKKGQELAREEEEEEDEASMSSELPFKVVEIAGEWKTDKEYYIPLIKHDKLLNKFKEIYVQEAEKNAKAVISSCSDKEEYRKDAKLAYEIEEKQASLEFGPGIENLEEDFVFKEPNIVNMEEFNKNLTDAAMNEALPKDCTSDQNQKQTTTYEDDNKEIKVKSPNEALFCNTFEKGVRMPEELQSTDEKEAFVQIQPCNNYEKETGITEDQCSKDAHVFNMEESDNIVQNDEDNELQADWEACISVKNELKHEAIHEENCSETPNAQGSLENTEFEDDTKETQNAVREDEKFLNQEINFEFLAPAEGALPHSILGTQVSSNLTDEACQLGEMDEADAGDESLPPAVQDAIEVSDVEVAENHKHPLCSENKMKINGDMESDTEPETRLEEEELQRKRETDRIAIERDERETHQQTLDEARKMAERLAVERATTEARQRALAEALEKAEKAAEAEKASREARLRAERAAVERATEEARRRAIEKALSEKAAADARERTAQLNVSNKDILTKKIGAKPSEHARAQTAASSINDHRHPDSHNNGGAESNLRFNARQDKHQQSAERAAKALAEKNMRDILAQREQAERDRLAKSLDGEVKKWSGGKDGNLRALLSTLQFILGPDSGWQPISLTDILNASAVRKAYRKATLCVHPDKLQQRGASIQQKYVCEKVFDLLQEAWSKFNSEER